MPLIYKLSHPLLSSGKKSEVLAISRRVVDVDAVWNVIISTEIKFGTDFFN